MTGSNGVSNDIDSATDGKVNRDGNDNGAGEHITASELVSLFKRRGVLDELRRDRLAGFRDSDANHDLKKAILAIIDREVAKDPEILARDRGKATALLEGVVSRSRESVQNPIDGYVSQHTVDDAALKRQLKGLLEALYNDPSQD